MGSAKNCLMMASGYSPSQLVFRHNPRLPCAMDDSLPALEGKPVINFFWFAKHLNAMHAAHRAFIQTKT